ncbi:hypothetical protein V491_03408 [Pseudogymnoascus sp. VKM F-3775]|nr:hypothetical protein V491_03408 [Pseudogymnoascus sp. VKM F-3775]
MATEVIIWKGTRLEPIFKALSTPHPGCPNVYAVDTEFCSIPGRLSVTEVAVVNMRTNNLVVHGVFNHRRGMVASAKLACLCRLKEGHPDFLAVTDHVRQVHTVEQMVQQIKECLFQQNDIMVEYSMFSETCLDMKNLRWLLDQPGCDANDLIPCNDTFGIIQPIKKFMYQVLPLDCWKLQLVFRVLFPSHPLVDQNHSAAVDTLQLAAITRLAFELSKPAEQRNLPANLLQGLGNLPSLSIETIQANTRPGYWGRTTSAYEDILGPSSTNHYSLINAIDEQQYDESADYLEEGAQFTVNRADNPQEEAEFMFEVGCPVGDAEFMPDKAIFSLEDAQHMPDRENHLLGDLEQTAAGSTTRKEKRGRTDSPASQAVLAVVQTISFTG